MEYLIDTNILIYYFNGSFTNEQKSLVDSIFNTSFNISIITKLEFLGWIKHTDESYKKAVSFISEANCISLEEQIIERTIQLKRQQSIKLPDAIIGATCLERDYALVTRNSADFKNIGNIKILNPFS